jgi:hypothetical protein
MGRFNDTDLLSLYHDNKDEYHDKLHMTIEQTNRVSRAARANKTADCIFLTARTISGDSNAI